MFGVTKESMRIRVLGWPTKITKSFGQDVKPRSRVTVLYTKHVKQPGVT